MTHPEHSTVINRQPRVRCPGRPVNPNTAHQVVWIALCDAHRQPRVPLRVGVDLPEGRVHPREVSAEGGCHVKGRRYLRQAKKDLWIKRLYDECPDTEFLTASNSSVRPKIA